MRTGWRKTWTIATFEFLTAVRRPGYLITTFGMPLFMAAYGGVVAIPAYFASRSVREPSVYGVVDPGDVLKLQSEVRVGVAAAAGRSEAGARDASGELGRDMRRCCSRTPSSDRTRRRTTRVRQLAARTHQGLLRRSAGLHREGRHRRLHAGHVQRFRDPSRGTRSRA